MALGKTRFHFSGTVAATNTSAVDAGWNTSDQVVRRRLLYWKTTGTPGAGSTINLAANQKEIDRQYEGFQLPAGVVFNNSRHVKGQLMVREVNTNDDVTELWTCLKIVSADGATVRCVLMDFGHYSGISTEFSTGFTNRKIFNGQTLTLGTEYTTVEGDRLLLEVGPFALTGGTTPAFAGTYGSNGSSAPEDNTSTGTLVGWIEFDFEFAPLATELARPERFFLGNAAAPVTPTVVGSGWGASGSAQYSKLEAEQQTGDALTVGQRLAFTAGQKTLDRGLVSDILADGIVFTTSVNVYGQVQGREFATADNVTHVVTGIHVISADGTSILATLLSVNSQGTGVEFLASGLRNKTIMSGVPLTAGYTTVNGTPARLLIEIGGVDTSGATPEVQYLYGTNGIPVGENELDEASGVGWIEFTIAVPVVTGQVRTFAASMSCTADLSCALRLDLVLAAVVGVTADLVAKINADRPLAASLQGTADLSASLKPDRQFSATLVVTSDLSGAANVERPLAANLVATADLAAKITGTVFLAANLAATADLVVAVAATRNLAASLQADAALVAAVAVDRTVSAALQATADLLARANVDRHLAANLVATADLLARIQSELRFAAALSATADLAARIDATRTLAAALQAEATLAALISVDRPLAAALLATVDLAVDLATLGQVTFAASLVATADLAAALRAERPLAASMVASVDLLARLEAFRGLAASLQAEANIDSRINVDRTLAAPVAASVDLAARLAAERPFAASMVCTADLLASIRADRNFAAALQADANLAARVDVDRGFACGLSGDANISVGLIRSVPLAAALVADANLVVSLVVSDEPLPFQEGNTSVWTVPALHSTWEVPALDSTWEVPSVPATWTA
jgi:hypothetical protein